MPLQAECPSQTAPSGGQWKNSSRQRQHCASGGIFTAADFGGRCPAQQKRPGTDVAAAQRQTAVTAHFLSKQLLLFAFALELDWRLATRSSGCSGVIKDINTLTAGAAYIRVFIFY